MATSNLRITRRGRIVVLGTLVTLLLAAFSLGRVGSEATPRGASSASTSARPSGLSLAATLSSRALLLGTLVDRCIAAVKHAACQLALR